MSNLSIIVGLSLNACLLSCIFQFHLDFLSAVDCPVNMEHTNCELACSVTCKNALVGGICLFELSCFNNSCEKVVLKKLTNWKHLINGLFLMVGTCPTPTAGAECFSGCQCKQGFVLNGAGDCVKMDQCPCEVGSSLYQPGATRQQDCNTW